VFLPGAAVAFPASTVTVPAIAEPAPRATQPLSRQIAEIHADRALGLYGAALAAANVLTSIQWQFRSGVSLMLANGPERLCWPFWERCYDLQLSVWTVHYTLWAFFFLSAAAAACFVARKTTTGYWLLAGVTVVRLAIMVQDYRLRANQHYMLNWVVLAFLFLPAKRAILQHVLVSLYFWAGALKLDPDWLTGRALYSQDRLWFPSALVPASCVYVVLLEMVLIWGLYARRSWIFYGTLIQLVVFHLTSWPIVGFWYPLLMFCLLAILPLGRLLDRGHDAVVLPWREPGARRVLSASVMGAFGAFQMIPHAFPGDTAVTGEGRVFALHMFDALVDCQATVTYRLSDGDTRGTSLAETRRLPHRSRCDPIIYFDLAKNECARIAAADTADGARPAAVDLDLELRSKRNSAADYRPVIDVSRFCALDLHYDMWRHNVWIQSP